MTTQRTNEEITQLIRTIYLDKKAKRDIYELLIETVDDIDKIRQIMQAFTPISDCSDLSNNYCDYMALYNNIVVHIIVLSKKNNKPLLTLTYIENEDNLKDVKEITDVFHYVFLYK
jgi:predicted P-loop ATPase/GTPase